MMPATCVPCPTGSPGGSRRGVDHVGGDAGAAVGVLEVRQVAADAGVDDGDADALAGDPGGPELVRADRLRVGRRQACRRRTPAAVHAGVLSVTIRTRVLRRSVTASRAGSLTA